MRAQRILAVDDEVNLREITQSDPGTAGYYIETADDGQETLVHFNCGEMWDLVLLDQRMPGTEGLEVLRRVRERDPSARIILATAYGSIELAVEATKQGAVEFLRTACKPDPLRGTAGVAVGGLHKSAPQAEAPWPTPVARDRETPLIHFRTLNGYQLSPVSLAEDEEETESLRIRRAFAVRSPAGALRRCAVDVTTSIRGHVREITGFDYPPEDPIWDWICRSALSNHLWEHAHFPPESLAVYSLTREQVQTIRAAAGVTLGRG